MVREEPEGLRSGSELLDTEGDRDAWLAQLRQGLDVPEREFRLYVRYLRALALLCECAPYVDDQDYLDLIDELLLEASAHYPIDVYQDEQHRQIAPRTVRTPITRS